MSRRGATALLWLLAGSAASALEVPPVPTRYLTDFAAVIPPGPAAAIERRFQEIETQTGHQALAVIFPTLGGEPLEDFTVRCAERWKVGRKGIDDGVIFFAFLQERKMRLEVGYGLEGKIPDAIARRILDNAVKPAFAAGDYAGGVLSLADSLQRVFSGEPVPAGRSRRGSPGSGLLIALVVGVILLRLLLGRGRFGRGSGGIFWGGSGGGGGGWSGGGFSSGGGSFGGGGASGSW
jgi:uncharacterized protein